MNDSPDDLLMTGTWDWAAFTKHKSPFSEAVAMLGDLINRYPDDEQIPAALATVTMMGKALVQASPSLSRDGSRLDGARFRVQAIMLGGKSSGFERYRSEDVAEDARAVFATPKPARR